MAYEGLKGNKNAVGNNGGRPLLYDNPDLLNERIEEYFAERELTKLPITITGLVLYLGFCDKKSFYDYEKRTEFLHVIKKARTRVEQYYEENLMSNHATGSIFALKNMGWSDKFEYEHSGDLDVKQIFKIGSTEIEM